MATSSIFNPALTGMWLPARAHVSPLRSWNGTPEIYFTKEIDNSRLVKVADRKRNREMAMFSIALGVLLSLVMVYAWQHFRAVEYGYQIEALKSQRDSLSDTNRALHLEEASLSDPERIDALAKKLGFATPQPGQVLNLEPPATDPNTPVLARASEFSVIAAVR